VVHEDLRCAHRFPGRHRWIPSIMALIALAGCVNVPPRDPGALDIPLPHAWLAHPIATDGVTLEGWVETFHDANLSALVQEALRRNYDLKAAAARVEAARAQARIEGASRRRSWRSLRMPRGSATAWTANTTTLRPIKPSLRSCLI
jgi:hypothetical protein